MGILPIERIAVFGEKIDAATLVDAPAAQGMHLADVAHDVAMIRQAEALGYVFGTWYSPACPEGELGSHHVDAVRPISAEKFAWARSNGWQM